MLDQMNKQDKKLAGFKPSTKSGAQWIDYGTFKRYSLALKNWQ